MPYENRRINVPCGKCGACLSTKRAEWTFRLKEELKTAKTAFFLTLTYSDIEVPTLWIDDERTEITLLKKEDVQLFIKRLRNKNKIAAEEFLINCKTDIMKNEYRDWPGIRYYLVGEYGPKTYRPHYHMIIFNLFHTLAEKLTRGANKDTGECQVGSLIQHIWEKGHVDVGSVTQASIHYVTKYFLTKVSDQAEIQVRNHYAPQFTLMSRRPGIGSGYSKRVKQYHKELDDPVEKFVVRSDGYPQVMPRYYRDKYFSIKEKEEWQKVCEEMSIKEWQQLREKHGDKWMKEYELRNKTASELVIKNAVKKSKL